MIIKIRDWIKRIRLKQSMKFYKKVYKWSQTWISSWVIEQLKPIRKIKKSINQNR